jgi:anti-sigma regulatory factor (Ser/Thr protein kinase)
MEVGMLATAVTDQSHVAQARRLAARLTSRLGGNDVSVSNISIIATELASNQVRHAGGGELLIQPWQDAEGEGIEILSLDKGRGMPDVDECFADGYSTGGTPGTGLGAVKRLSTRVDVWSQPGLGTVLLARIRLRQWESRYAPRFVWGAVSQPIAGEEDCGDAWSIAHDQSRMAFFVADGLGHGTFAARAAQAAAQTFRERSLKESPAAAMQAIHRSIGSSRGAAAAIAEFRHDSADLTYCGVGNIAGTVISNGQLKKLVSISGTLGHIMRTAREFSYPAPSGSILVMHSDGLQTNWSLDSYPGLLTCHPSIIAGLMYRDFKRGRDDTTVLVVRRLP